MPACNTAHIYLFKMNFFKIIFIFALITNAVLCYITNNLINKLKSHQPQFQNIQGLYDNIGSDDDRQPTIYHGDDLRRDEIATTYNDLPLDLVDDRSSGSSSPSSSSVSSPVTYEMADEPNNNNNNKIISLQNTFGKNSNQKFSNDLRNDLYILNKLRADIKEEEEIAMKSSLLLKLLENPTDADAPLPVIYIGELSDFKPNDDHQIIDAFVKRSGRYYRRYPWKRQNTKYKVYEADSRYLCVPSREDVFKLLIGLHENRNGNHHKTVNFCNRKRPAKSIFTNIRFLG